MTDTATAPRDTARHGKTGPVGVGVIGAGVISDQYLGTSRSSPT